jgi:hypothetical protein
MSEHKGLLVSVFRSAQYCDCTMSGISAAFPSLVLFGTDEMPMDGYIDRNAYGRPEAELRRGPLGDPYVWLPPAPGQGSIGPVMGGNYAATSDSRFAAAVGFYGAVPIHDRYETAWQNEMMSD